MDVSIDISNIQLETERLILRAWRESDLNDFYEYASVEGVGEMAGWPHHTDIEVTKTVLTAFINEKAVFALELKETGQVIGSLGLHTSWGNEDPNFCHLALKEIGYVLSKAHWGKGLMPEAVQAVINYYFDKDQLDAFTIGHFNSNPQSRRVIEKMGFKYVKDSEYYASLLDQTFQDKKYILMK